ncbi:ATP-dependent nuclease [Azospirillum canadense]|uniref:ATP-dependent nuclease n=1 Tax=Azospirillum canadense TaxID=403962 RepID=UPI002227C925|nr:AAA family ATPase [Azospirillum canadense]MCW2236654.1 energy-coupling factor transporter ATP-binding protein EcfA2 [Azospirillum canadense]
MKIKNVLVHNFRSIADCKFSLDGYNLIIGSNNSGKTNIIDALRVFYEKQIKWDDGRDFPKFPTNDAESWIEVEYLLENDEYKNLKEDYRLPDNILRVRKYLKSDTLGSDGKPRSGIYAYTNDGLSTEHFYGMKNVQQGKLGDVVYIPATSKLDDHTKMSGPSPLRDLINDITKKLIGASAAYSTFSDQFNSFVSEFKTEQTNDLRSFTGLEQDINAEIGEWGAKFELTFNPVTEADIVKNLVGFHIHDLDFGGKLDATSFGQGFQRHLIYTLIKVASKYQTTSQKSAKKDFSPALSLLLFEEPEAYLHPVQQESLCRSLQQIGKKPQQQVLASTHSTNFVNHNSDDLTSIVRLSRFNGKTIVGQILKESLTSIFSDNQQINHALAGTKLAADTDDLKYEMEAIKYFMWLDPERCGMFFARRVLMVEGPTEKILVNYLIRNGLITTPKGGLFILDCMGKFNIHRFMNLLGPMNIHHSILMDGDNNKPPHDKIKEIIESSTNAYTIGMETLPTDLEGFLEIDKPKDPRRKPQHLMLKLKDASIKPQNIAAFCDLIHSLICVDDIPQNANAVTSGTA